MVYSLGKFDSSVVTSSRSNRRSNQKNSHKNLKFTFSCETNEDGDTSGRVNIPEEPLTKVITMVSIMITRNSFLALHAESCLN